MYYGMDELRYRVERLPLGDTYIKEDDEYINNWVEKWDMLCEPKWKIGLLGALAFFGVLISTAFIPVLSDKIGRKLIYIITLGLSVLI